MRPLSLGVRLFLSLSLVMLFTLAVVALLGLRSADKKIAEEFDAELITTTNVLWEITRDDVEKGDYLELDITDSPQLKRMHQISLEEYSQWRAFRIWKDGKVVIQSDNTEDLPERPATAGFSDMNVDDETWRVFALHVPEDHMVIESFENLNNRLLLQHDILLGVALPMLFILPLLAALILLGIRFGLVRLNRFTTHLNMRSPDDMSHLEVNDLPKELTPLARALNELLAKLQSAMTREREFIDHAAHELRTPLSALKLQAQLLAKSLPDSVPDAPIQDLLKGVDRISRLIDQLLLLSRIPQQGLELVPVNLHEAARESIGMHAVQAIDKGLTLSLEGEATLTVTVQPEMLRILIGTLLDNAIKYTPKGGEIILCIAQKAGKSLLNIRDSGPGINASELPHVFERFYRSPNATQPGSGLGLAIARQIAELLHAQLRLTARETGTGLVASVEFVG